MLPLRDRNPSGSTPLMMYAIITANVVVFIIQLRLPHDALMQVAMTYGLVPAQVSRALRGEADLLRAAVIPAFTSMFLHGGWFHLLANMWFLRIFGDNVEDRLGHVGFVLFYLVCGLGAAGLHLVLSPASEIPMVGASGAIAGVLGAYAVLWPGARVVTLIPFFFLPYLVELPAFVVLFMWFLLQFLQGVATLGVEVAHGGVAYWAHVGGFVVGVLLVVLWPTGPSEG